MYKILLVDDEMPALRFLQAIIEKYAPGFAVAELCTDGEAALTYLKANRVDLLITDISMPGMDGIALSMRARALAAGLHIVIVSGYAEFEYAKGAIQAAVEDYILKPVSVPHMAETLARIKRKLDDEISAKEPALLFALLSGQPYDKTLADRLYGAEKYFFALIRFGNLRLAQRELHSASFAFIADMPFRALCGRDEEEQILFRKADQPAADFQAAVKAYAAQRKSATWTIIFARTGAEFTSLADFFRRASQLLERTVVIGRRQFAFLSGSNPSVDIPRVSSSTLKRLELFLRDGNMKMIQNIFVSLAIDWEKRQIPQIYVATMVHQLIHLALAERPAPSMQQDMVLRAANELLRYAVSYGDLMSGLYSVLFDDSALRDKKMAAEDLYAYAVHYIQDKYAQPISIQHVCSEIGISQTYLSRLFRKYGNTSFNVYLTKCRMENAMAFMREHPEMPLRSVAECVGYEDYAYFSKVFHQIVGCPPSQWAASLGEMRQAQV